MPSKIYVNIVDKEIIKWVEKAAEVGFNKMQLIRNCLERWMLDHQEEVEAIIRYANIRKRELRGERGPYINEEL